MVQVSFIEIDEGKCSHCMKCMLVCSAQHEGMFNPRLARLRIGEDYIKGWVPHTYCRQCPSPAPCEEVCSAEAIFRSNNGALVIDGAKCTACGACLDACPYNPGVIWIHPTKRVAVKCDLCDGDDPQCVEYCPGGAIKLKKVIFKE